MAAKDKKYSYTGKLVKALKLKIQKPNNMKDDDWKEMRDLANSIIQLFLENSTLREVINEMDLTEA